MEIIKQRLMGSGYSDPIYSKLSFESVQNDTKT